MKLIRHFAAILWVLMFSATGCGLEVVHPEIEISIENRSARDAENTRARFGDYECSWGYVSSGAKKIYGMYPHPLTDETELHWDIGGKHRVKKFDLRKFHPRERRGRLEFVIYDERAEVDFRESDQK